MKLVINEKYINNRKKIAQVTTMASLAVLAAGLVFAFGKDQARVLYSYIALIVGFVLSQVGMYFTNRFGRSPRFDEVLTSAFEKLRHEYSFYVYASPVPMVLLGPCGFWLPIPVTANGTVSYENGKWKQKGGNFLMKFMGQETIGDPERDAEKAIADLRKHLAAHGITEEEQPTIKPIMVVMMKNTTLGNVDGAPIPVWNLEVLKRQIRREDRENCTKPISPELQERIEAALAAPVSK